MSFRELSPTASRHETADQAPESHKNDGNENEDKVGELGHGKILIDGGDWKFPSMIRLESSRKSTVQSAK